MNYFKRKRTNKRNKKRGTKKYRGGAPDDFTEKISNFKMEIIEKLKNENETDKDTIIGKLETMLTEIRNIPEKTNST